MGGLNSKVCHICKEPVGSFICPDCIAKGIKEWLPEEFSFKFDRFHNVLLFYFDAFVSGSNTCVNCKVEMKFSLCHYCYTNHAVEWMKEENKNLAARFKSEFSFKAGSHRFNPGLLGRMNRKGFGICDDCGKYTEILSLEGREWLCQSCDKPVENSQVRLVA